MSKEIYKNVKYRVLFGDFESDTFEQMYGLKQGCVMSPTIFNVLMNELTNNLNESGIGSQFAETIINSLLFAYDIVLIADSMEALENLLSVTSSFADSWNLKLNANKTQVMVIGIILADKTWKIGNYLLKETNEYKYLGVYLSRSMKSHYHINNYIKEKAENKINGLIRLLNDHGDFNRIEFGSTVWQSVILPSIGHGCSVWFPTSISDTNILESLQYQAARAIVKIRSYPPKCALIRELGWEPIHDYLNRKRFTYYSRLKILPNVRLCKIVFNELFSNHSGVFEGPWNYPNMISNIDRQYNLDCFANESVSSPGYKYKIGRMSYKKVVSRCLEKSSLHFYNNCLISRGNKYSPPVLHLLQAQ